MGKLRITDGAQTDLLDIWLYIAKDSERAADALTEKIIEKFDQLLQLPQMGRERFDVRPDLRSFLVGSYVIFYTVVSDGIEIVRVFHGARDIENVF